MKYQTSPTLRPPPTWYGDLYERSSDPWHRDAFPEGLKDAAPNQGQRSDGWMALDSWGNPIGYVADGTWVEATPKQMLGMSQQQRDELMRLGADEAIKHGLY